MAKPATDAPELGREAALRVDAACDRFEAAWREGCPMPLTTAAGASAGPERTVLLHHLVLLDIDYRRRAGLQPKVVDYQGLFDGVTPEWLMSELNGGTPKASNSETTVIATPPADEAHKVTTSFDAASKNNGESPLPTLPGYEILDKLGHGAMGVVYRARQIRVNRLVAVKMMLGQSHCDPNLKARFFVDMKAIASLQHRNIVQVFDAGEHEGQPYFSLEYCPGGSLEKKLNGTPLPARKAAETAEALARAMDVAHHKPGKVIIHRDLKPANILLDDEGTPKITDFGLAKMLDHENSGQNGSGQTQPGTVMGTPSYMAPEQAQGRTDIGATADIYALGAILYECLTGRPPFRAATVQATLNQVINDEPVPVRRLKSKVPRPLEIVCLKCLEKEPAKRYASASALADDLRRFLEDRPIQGRPPGMLERTLRWCRRRPAAAALIGVSIIGVLALIVAYWQLSEENGRTKRARDDATKAERDLQLALTRQLAERLDSDLRQLAAGPQTMATLVSARPDWEDEHLKSSMYTALRHDDKLFGMCTAFEPGKFLSAKEPYARYVYRENREITDKQLRDDKNPFWEWDWFRLAKDRDSGFWGEPYFDRLGGGIWMVTYSEPVRHKGEFVGVVTADLSTAYFDRLQDNLQALNFGPGSYGFVVSRNGKIISHPDARFSRNRNLADIAEQRGDDALTALVERILKQEDGEGRAIDFRTDKPARFLFAPIASAGWSVVAVVPEGK